MSASFKYVGQGAFGAGEAGSAYTFEEKTGSTTATAADGGKIFQFTGSGAATLTLPLAAVVGAGWRLVVDNRRDTYLTVARTVSDNIYGTGAYYLNGTECAEFISDGVSTWTVAAKGGPGMVFWRAGGTLSSATTLALNTDANYFSVSGTTTITGFSTTGPGLIVGGVVVRLLFTDVLTLTHNATSFILPGEANITTAANDVATFIQYNSVSWRCIGYQRADGSSLRDLSRWVQGADITSSSTLTFTSPGNSFDITGINTLFTFSSTGQVIGDLVLLRFTNATGLRITHNGVSLILPGAANIDTAAGDLGTFVCIGTNQWRCTNYQKADGTAVIAAGGGGGNPSGYVTDKYYLSTACTPSSATFGVAASRIYYFEFFAGATETFTRIGIEVTSAAGTNARVGIYNAAANGVPGTLLVDAGTISTASVAIVEATISQELTAGTLYYLALIADAAVTLRGVTTEPSLFSKTVGSDTPSQLVGYVHEAGSGSTLPATAAAVTRLAATTAPSIFIRKV